jgi:Co/Zn/Cd efflux system component
MLAMAIWKGYADENAPGSSFGYSFALFITGYCLIFLASFLFYEAVPDSKDPLFSPDQVHKMALYAFILAIIGVLLTVVGVGLPDWGNTEALPAFSGRLGLYQYCYTQQGVPPNPGVDGCTSIDADCHTTTLTTPPQDLQLRECPRLNSVRGFSILSFLIGVVVIVGSALGYFKDSARGKLVAFVSAVVAAVCGFIAMGVWLQYFERNLESGGDPRFPFPNAGLGAAFGLHVGGAIFYSVAAMLAYIARGSSGGGGGAAASPAQMEEKPRESTAATPV